MTTAKPNAPRGKMNNAFNPNDLDHLDAETRKQVERRMRLLGPSYRLFYSNPVEISKAKGVLLWDKNGNEYLDAYNNVVSIGHGHPRVIKAVAEQMEKLCTHTRYVSENILNFAEKLLGTFGGRIGETGHAMFTCTGSEANDLAIRIAKHYTGKNGIIVTSEAYHGNSDMTASFSPSLGENSALGTWVRRVTAPDSYRLPPEKIGQILAEQVREQIKDLERHGDGLAAFVVDSLFTSDGIYPYPKDVLAPVAEVVKEAGGLFIADEVQCGFGRCGDAMWGYQRHGIDPDIVTMGKPMGNGYPVAGIAVAPEVVAEFGRDMRYFNTFGGNTVAIAAATATFDVIVEEKLMENCAKVGDIILEGLQLMAKRYPQIGDVRGVGLYLGVEIISDAANKTPDQKTATTLVNALRDRRVLISATGFHGNVLKIRPPLVFTAENAERLLAEIDAVFASL
ncbi:aspartate aminotransferase family protein [Pantoea cypripedii]|uniref:Aspartate aminotransferase family protein n=1 Tax=Pantoea cypripedii TaxID=55209 RepID=A0A6B9GC57_PANCY|nr:aspartate aminotransferase family protein [Pantoea cypripedii]QGY32960.1 aspartate aminotransferase family protein [Pantoea cypripedii]